MARPSNAKRIVATSQRGENLLHVLSGVLRAVDSLVLLSQDVDVHAKQLRSDLDRPSRAGLPRADVSSSSGFSGELVDSFES